MIKSKVCKVQMNKRKQIKTGHTERQSEKREQKEGNMLKKVITVVRVMVTDRKIRNFDPLYVRLKSYIIVIKKTTPRSLLRRVKNRNRLFLHI